MKKIFILLSILLCAPLAEMRAQVDFTQRVEKNEGILVLSFTGRIADGWHLYSTEVVEDGPTRASLNVETIEGLEYMGSLKASPAPKKQFDEMFGTDLYFHEKNVTFTQMFRITAKSYHLAGYLEYGACNDEMCLPPTPVEFDYSGDAEAPKAEETPETPETPESLESPEVPETLDDTTAVDTLTSNLSTLNSDVDLWAPTKTIPYEEVVSGSKSGVGAGNGSLWSIFLMGIIGGLLALVTPCVWPIIPMTVSYFLKRGGGVKDAVVYGISIIVIYLLLGLIVTAVFGASALNALSTNAVFNIFFFLLLVVFALSFFGLFEIKLPESWGNKVDQQADKAGGMLGIFLMAFTLTLVSFSCTGPIIGFLLVEVATMGSIVGPAVGMFGFALALALPFALFAMFPSWLKQMPKSGSWMDTVKVVLGFIELFFSLKFLSVADMAYGWHILDRDWFVLIWILLALALGLYLIGLKVKWSKVHIIRWVLGLASFLFALYMIPGIWGAPLKEISAFTPPMSTQHIKLIKTEVEPQFHDYEEGMKAAKEQGKPAFIDFTGYGCVNCRKMEAAVWTDPEVAKKLNEDFVLIQLFVDDKTPLPEKLKIDGRTLRTVGDKWSYLQSSKFGANAQPFYVILDAEGNVMDGSYGYDEDILQFKRFLNDGLNSFSPPKDETH